MLRLQLELSQAKGDLERQLQEKEEEAEAVRYLIFLDPQCSSYKAGMGNLLHKGLVW